MFESLLANYGLIGIFLAGFLEEIIAIIPSSLVFLAAGALLVKSGGDILLFGILGAAGVTLGSFLIYALVYWGGEQVIVRYGKYFGLRWRDVEKFRDWFVASHFDEAILVGTRAIPVFSNTVISAFSGLIQLHPWPFAWTTFIGSVVRVGILVWLGWTAGREYLKYSFQLEEMEKYLIIAFIAAVLVITFYIYEKRKKRPAAQ